MAEIKVLHGERNLDDERRALFLQNVAETYDGFCRDAGRAPEAMLQVMVATAGEGGKVQHSLGWVVQGKAKGLKPLLAGYAAAIWAESALDDG